MRMRKTVLLLMLCMLLTFSASAQQVLLPLIPAQVDVSTDSYTPMLTPENLSAHESFIVSKGGTLAGWKQEWKDKGILLMAYDEKNSRRLVISAVMDADAQRFGDIDQQTPGTRAQFRREHLKEGSFVDLGYKADSAEWRNFPGLGRFLMIRYNYRGSEPQHRGFMRRSVKNGLTITLDMQVYGRSLKGADNTALNKVFDSFAFTGNVAQGVSVSVFLNETQSAPKETYLPNFTMKGSTKAGTQLQAVVMSFETNKPETFRTEADAKGNYSLPITLPAEGIYLITLSASSEGMEPLEKSYSVTYAKDLLPVEFTSEFPKELTANSYRIAGKTESGVTVQMIVNEKNTTRKTNNQKTFSFNVPTATDGTYKVRLSFAKTGFATRLFDYEGVRAAQNAAPALPETATPVNTESLEALSPSYTDLIAKADEYDGKQLTYDGYVVSVTQEAGDYVVALALRKAVTGYADTLMLVSATDPAVKADSKVRITGTLVGISDGQEGGINMSYPRIKLSTIELLEEPQAQPA